jgi:hypothetical protein
VAGIDLKKLKTFHINFLPQILDKFPIQNNLYKFVLVQIMTLYYEVFKSRMGSKFQS